jgi:hypothetical protein
MDIKICYYSKFDKENNTRFQNERYIIESKINKTLHELEKYTGVNESLLKDDVIIFINELKSVVKTNKDLLSTIPIPKIFCGYINIVNNNGRDNSLICIKHCDLPLDKIDINTNFVYTFPHHQRIRENNPFVNGDIHNNVCQNICDKNIIINDLICSAVPYFQGFEPITTTSYHDNLKWSHNGPIDGMTCIKINEPAEPSTTTWDNNFLCSSNTSISKWLWKYDGYIKVNDMKCILWSEKHDPHTWNDNYLCIPLNQWGSFIWSNSGPIADMNCINIIEPNDVAAWNNNYFCYK